MPLSELRYFSDALQKHTAAFVLLPDRNIKPPYHVMFLLHGLSDDHSAWQRWTSIERYVAGLPLVVVMPDGGRGFYCDAQEGFAYGTAIGVELPSVVAHYFPTKRPWCIAGLSMGGYGAAKLALEHPDLFVSAHSLSGALAFSHRVTHRGEKPSAEFVRIQGAKPAGGPNDLFALAEKLKPGKRPKLRIDCGTEDFLLEDNREFHAHLTSLGFAHEYEEFPGDHSWPYWDLHIQESIAFHRKNLGI